MLKIKNNTQKTLSIIGIVGLLLANMFPSIVNAADITIPDSLLASITTSGATYPILNSTDNQGSSSNKQQLPQVTVNFSEDALSQAGTKKMVATATPSYFKNDADPKSLYFTWYLKRAGCDLSCDDGSTPDKNGVCANHKNAKKVAADNGCNLDGDEYTTVNDWKIAAAKIIIKGSFDSSRADYSAASFDAKLSGYEATPSPIDDWKINDGKDSNDEDAPNCSVQDPASGLIYELRRVEEKIEPCPDPTNYQLACIKSGVSSVCDVLNPAYTEIDAAADALIKAQIAAANTWNNDPVNNTPANIANGTYPQVVPAPYQPSRTIQKTTKQFCATTSKTPYCKIKDETDLANFTATVSCPGSGTEIPMCVKKTGNTLYPDTSPIEPEAAVFKTEELCNSTLKPNTNAAPSLLVPPPTWLYDDLDASVADFSAVENQTCDIAKTKIINGNTNLLGVSDIQESCTFEKSEDGNMCKHLFPKVPDAVTGDGKFTLKEKQFWQAAPMKVSTTGVGKDEENAVGVGVDKFSWIYSAGDKVGVVVEGASIMQNNHKDNSELRTWAFSNNTCKALTDLSDLSLATGENGEDSEGKRGFYMEGAGVTKVGFLTAEIDLDDCLEENLLDPVKDSAYALAVNLTTDPQNPINDFNGGGDTLNIYSASTNTQAPGALLYKWVVQKSADGSTPPIDTTNWLDITSAMIDGNSFSSTDIGGLGKKDLAINLNMTKDLIERGFNDVTAYEKGGGAFYLKIRVKITGGAADGSQNAEGAVIVRVVQQQDRMVVYPVTMSNSGDLSINSGTTSICDDKAGQKQCNVAKYGIIGIIIPSNATSSVNTPFSWTVNGVDFPCSSSISTQCSNGNTLFFPVIGNDGETINVIARGLNKNGEIIKITRQFLIVPAKIEIAAQDTSSVWPKLLGYYKDLGGNKYPDYSSVVFETNPGNTMVFNATAISAFNYDFSWTIDGQLQDSSAVQNNSQITIPVNKQSGDSYTVGIVSKLASNVAQDNQINNLRRALMKNWSISPDDFTEEISSADIQINIVGTSAQTVVDSGKTGIFASLVTNLPEQLMFLLKIILTGFLLIFSMGLLFSFIPDSLFEKTKNKQS